MTPPATAHEELSAALTEALAAEFAAAVKPGPFTDMRLRVAMGRLVAAEKKRSAANEQLSGQSVLLT